MTYVTWYGATAICNYYGYRLPTELEWQAVADYEGEFNYGCGIDIDNLDNIFIPFYTTRTKGSGIGLSLAKQIMRLHNGQISIKSDGGNGAEFILKF